MNFQRDKMIFGAMSLVVAYHGVRIMSRALINKVSDSVVKTIMTDIYDENMWEFISASNRVGQQVIVETNMRSQEGTTINRPLGPPKNFPSLDDLMFSFAQLDPMPTPLEIPVDTTVLIGKKAKKPFTIALPMMIAGMAYGEALSAKAKWALAKGAAKAGTASCNGEGPFLSEERKAANIYIYQYHRGDWNKTPDILQNCHAIEIQFGQGAIGGVGHVMPANKIDRELRQKFKYPKGKDAVAHSRQLEAANIEDVPKLINKLREISGGVPIGAKMAASKKLERDLEVICNAGIDYIALEGAEAATKGSAPILQDDFGVPTVYAVSRAAEWLQKNNYKDKVSLIACGKIRTPGDALKAIALGADACYIGAIALFAMAHDQVLKALPFEPPTQLVWYDGKYEDKLIKEKAAQALEKFLKSCQAELEEGIKALGKTSLKEINKDDLSAINEQIAKGTGVSMAYEPYYY